MTRKSIIAIALVIVLLIIDQCIKLAVKTHMTIGEQIVIFDWFRICFIENNGMAWGMELGSKLFLSLFRIVAVIALLWYVFRLIKRGARMAYILVLSMICAGAAGNIFDSLFYGQLLTASTPFDVSEWTAWGEGYAPMLRGKVVDMFYFPLIHGTFPSWFPLWGGEDFIFFSPVFNFADACISVGVIVLLLFFRKELNETFGETAEKPQTPQTQIESVE